MPDNLSGGRSAVDENCVALFNQRCRQRADAMLLFRVGLGAERILRFQPHALAEYGAAVGAFEDAFRITL